MNLRIALALVCIFACVQLADAQFVRDVTVVGGKSEGAACPSGYDRINQDLNAGAGGDFIYLCVQITSDFKDALAEVQLLNLGSTPLKDAGAVCGGDVVPYDLNRGAGGSYIYFCKKKLGSGNLVWDRLFEIKFNTTTIWQATPPQKCPFSGFFPMSLASGRKSEAEDLNHNAGGKFIYACVRT